MTKTKMLSVIVPVYRVEAYLSRCLDSILRQEIPNMEILVIDDGSPDDCWSIMQSYADRFPDRIRIFQKINGGLSDARNYGLDRAEGRYIAFADSDDYLADGMYAAMLEHAEAGGFDLTVCDLRYVYPERTMDVASGIASDLRSREDVRASMTRIYPAAWNKLYRAELFADGLRYKKGVWFEDVELLYRMYPRIRSIGAVSGAYYQYVQRPGAITSVFDKRQFDYLRNWESILAQYRRDGLFEAYKPELQYCCARYAYATFLKGAAKAGDRTMYRRGCREARRLLRDSFSRPGRNPYFYKNGLKGLYLLTFNSFSAACLYAATAIRKGTRAARA